MYTMGAFKNALTGFSKSWCNTVSTSTDVSRYGHFQSRACEEPLNYVCQLDYTKYVCLPGRSGKYCGDYARLNGLPRLDSTGFDEFPLANATANPIQNAIYDQMLAGTLDLFILNGQQYDYDLAIQYWFKSNYVAALPNMRYYWDNPDTLDRPDMVSPNRANRYDWLDFSLPKHWPVDCGFLRSRKTGVTKPYCAKSAQFCDADYVILPALMNPSIYPQILLPVNDTASIVFEPTCALSIRPLSFVTADQYGGVSPGFEDQFTLVGSDSTGGVQIQAASSTVQLFNSLKNPTAFVYVSNFTVTGSVQIDCLACTIGMAVFIGPIDTNGLFPSNPIFVYNATVPAGTTRFSDSFLRR